MGRYDDEFSGFVAERSPRLLLVARSICGDPHLAEDLVQSALIKAYARWPRLRRADDPYAYVRRVLVNLNIDRMRRRSTYEAPADVVHETPTADLAGQVVLTRVLSLALDGLSPRERAVVTLRYLEDLSEADTAGILGMTTGAVKSATHRAVGKLRSSEELAETI
jgi:RNA polymerase sigma-70 factor (sigma-E family)